MNAGEVAAGPPLRLVTKNVGGLSSCPRKRGRLFTELARKASLDIILLQETHSVDDATTRRWTVEAGSGAWRGQLFWHHGTSASRGVAVLIRDTAPVTEARVTYKDDAGRILRVDFKYAGASMAVVNVYAPSVAVERAAFYTVALPLAMAAGGSTLVAGDFNCVLREEDKWGVSQFAHRFVGRDQLEAFMLTEDIEDTWKLPAAPGKPPHGRQPTFHTNVASADGVLTYTAARLDRWLTPVGLRAWVVDTLIHPLREDFLPRDHGAIVLNLQPPVNLPAAQVFGFSPSQFSTMWSTSAPCQIAFLLIASKIQPWGLGICGKR